VKNEAAYVVSRFLLLPIALFLGFYLAPDFFRS
jgi:hypothetical protein